jgi:citrate synthase
MVIGGEEYLTVEEAAARLGVKPATLYAYVSRGLLRSYREGRRRQRLYRRADVDGLRRLEPSRRSTAAPVASPIPLAESWIRE